ncbi:MAG: 3-hydroxyacyl-CoA dehydrogenase family protein [Elusimicrobiales bacterium]
MTIEGIGIIGANRKTTLLSYMLVEKGFQVRVYDSFKESLLVLYAKVKWRLEKEGRADLLSSIETVQDYSKFHGADLIIDLSSKTYEERFLYFSKILKEVDDRCIIAISTHTPLLDNFERIRNLPPERSVGVKFPDIFPWSVIEVSKTDYTDLEAVERFSQFIDKLSVKYIITSDIPGGLSEIFLRIYFNAAFNILYKGKGLPSFIDSAIKQMTGSKYGPFELLDLGGIDNDYNAGISISEMLNRIDLVPHEIEHKLFQYGQLGRKSGVGVYIYEDGEIVGENPVLPSIIRYLGMRRVSKEEVFSDIVMPILDVAISVGKNLMVGEQDIETLTRGIFGWEHGIFGYRKLYPELFIKKEKSEFDNLE